MKPWRAKAIVIIDRIEDVRSENNIRWMNLLRAAVIHLPKEAVMKLFMPIRENDKEIGRLWKSLQKTLRD